VIVPRTPQHKQNPPPGYVWIDGAARLSGRTIETLYKDRSQQRRGVPCNGPRSVDIGRKAAWRIADIEAWLAAAPDVEPNAQHIYNSRPAEPAIAAA
jgi:predicted DNA-binding transcriptional regulator AlpA